MSPDVAGPNDEALLIAHHHGDPSALETLIGKHQRGVFGLILRMVKSHAEAEDLFQETWTRVLRSLDRYKEGHFRAWLYRIAHNVTIDRLRHSNRETAFDHPGADNGTNEEGHHSPADILPAPGLTPDREVAGHDLGRVIAAALTQLPPEQREVFLLRTEGDLPFNEIARLQGVSINTALARMQYAVQKLRRLLYAEHDELQVDNNGVVPRRKP